MRITVRREKSQDGCTIGEVSVDGQFQCWSLEDVVRPAGEPKVFGETAIPEGVYKVTWTFSPHFQRKTLRVNDVPGFSGVLIHGGNTAENTEGCLLVGRQVVRDSTKIIESKEALEELQAKVVPKLVSGEAVVIEYINYKESTS